MPVLGGVDGIDGYANVAGGFRTGIVAAPLMARVAAQDIVDETPDVPIEPYLVDRFGNQ
jgi:hydrogen cyanide synthase HcnC